MNYGQSTFICSSLAPADRSPHRKRANTPTGGVFDLAEETVAAQRASRLGVTPVGIEIVRTGMPLDRLAPNRGGDAAVPRDTIRCTRYRVHPRHVRSLSPKTPPNKSAGQHAPPASGSLLAHCPHASPPNLYALYAFFEATPSGSHKSTQTSPEHSKGRQGQLYQPSRR